jgi:hypothetical protein
MKHGKTDNKSTIKTDETSWLFQRKREKMSRFQRNREKTGLRLAPGLDR